MKISSFGRIVAMVFLLIGAAGASAYSFVLEDTGMVAGNPAGPLSKVTITNDGNNAVDTFNWSWLVPAGTTGDSVTPVDITAEGVFKVVSFNDSEMVLDITIKNTTDLSSLPGTNSSILSFGFGVMPDVVGTFVSGGEGAVFDGIGDGNGGQQSFPGGFKQIDVCIFAANGCAGGAQPDGLQASTDGVTFQSDTVSVALTAGTAGAFGDSPPTLMLFDFPLKFQGTWGSFEVGGAGNVPGDPVPEPATLGLLLLGLAGLRLRSGFIRRAKPN